MAARIQFKRGDTFLQQCTLKDDANPSAPVPQDITAWTVKSQVRDNQSNLISDCEYVVIDALNGIFQLWVRDTTQWPLGGLFWDIQYTTAAGQIVSTDTIAIDCKKDITQP